MLTIHLNRPYYYCHFIEDSQVLKEKYKDLLEVTNIGYSHDNREIIMFRIGKGEKSILLTGGVHGRESINPIVLMKMIEHYCSLEQEEYSIYMIPLLNPDGYMIAQRGFNVIANEELRLCAKKTNIPYFFWKYNARCVDLNRNFPSRTWRSKTNGDYPISENETSALVRVMKSIKTEGYIDYHSRGKEVYYYRGQMDKVYNKKQLKIAKSLCKLSGYTLVSPDNEVETGDTGGNTVHYYSEYIQKPALTIETVSNEIAFPLPVSLQEEVYDEIVNTPFVLLET